MIKRQGFTLAEALITLIVISLVMAATMPIVLKSQSSPSEAPVKFVTIGDIVNSAVYSGLGNTSTLVLGSKNIPIDKNVADADKSMVFATKLNPKLSILSLSNLTVPMIAFYEKTYQTVGSQVKENYNRIGQISFDEYYNVGIGIDSLQQLTSTKTYNTAIGQYSNTEVYTGIYTTSLGANALKNATTGERHVAFGYAAMQQATGASNYIHAFGASAIKNVRGGQHLAIGSSAMENMGTGGTKTYNNIIGNHSMVTSNSSNSQYNIVVGSQTKMMMTGYMDNIIGYGAMKNHYSGNYNTAIGAEAMGNGYAQGSNIAIGYQAAQNRRNGSYNMAVGYQSGKGHTNGATSSYNTSVGTQSLASLTSGSYNIAIGTNSLYNVTTGTNNIAIGNNLTSAASNSYKLHIGGVTAYNTSTKALTSTRTSDSEVFIYGDMEQNASSAKPIIRFNTLKNEIGLGDSSKAYIHGNAYITYGGSNYQIATIAYIQSLLDGATANGGTLNYTRTPSPIYSDARLKNITGDNTAGLKEILQLKVKNYTMKKDKKKEPLVGVIAQDLQKVFPNSVYEGRDGYLRIKRDEIFYACVNAIKELAGMFQDAMAKIAGLEEKIRIVEDRIKINKEKLSSLEEQNKKFKEQLSVLEKEITEIEEKTKQTKRTNRAESVTVSSPQTGSSTNSETKTTPNKSDK